MLLELKNVSKKFNQQIVLDDVDFSVDTGKLILIRGANGSGKSTIFKLIVKIIEADSGEIVIDDNANIGALIENPMFMEDSNFKNNMKFLAKIKNNFDESVIKDLTKRLGLDYDNKLKLSKYSIGMRQKAGIIQAIMEEQNLILLDEPTRGLDQDALPKFFAIINELIANDKTVIITSHEFLNDLNFDATYELKEGKLSLKQEN
ncbi:MAG: ABC transporter ATP-binding protein [Lactobacillaceae bacterium]|nr:ABC transporter ATP-binding protein [Lactobacillaceae bacterium]